MRKLKLDVDTLAVESFEPSRVPDLRATVEAREVTAEPDCQYSLDYGDPCNTLDPMSGCPTCADTCAHTCGSTCEGTCRNTCDLDCTVLTDPLIRPY